MKILTLGLLVFVSFSGLAGKKSYNLKLDVSFEDQLVSSTDLQVHENETAKIYQNYSGQKFITEVVSKAFKDPQGSDLIHMNFLVAKIDSEGTKKIVSKSEIIAVPDEKAEITVSGLSKPETLSISVIAN